MKIPNFSSFIKNISRWSKWMLFMIVPAIAFVWVVNSYFWDPVRQNGTLILYGFKYTLPALALLFLVVFSLPGWQGKLAALITSCMIFGLALSGLWANASSDSNIIMGLIPVSDARGYLHDALRLLDGINFSSFASRRPIFTSFFASVLFFSGQKITLTVAVITLINAVCCFEFAWMVRKKWGTVAGVISMLVLFFFFRRFIGSVMSETIGLALGTLGFVLLCDDNYEGEFQWKSLLGIFTLSIGLLARAGTFFILPCLVIWFLFRKRKGLKLNWKQGGAAVIVITAAFGVNALFYSLLGSPGNSVPFANFSYSFYGLVNGGTSWEKVFSEHPELLQLPESKQVQVIYQLCLDTIRSNPALLIKGIFTEYAYLVSPGWYNAYSYFLPESESTGFIIQYLLLGLALIGITVSFIKRKQPLYQLILAITLGFLLSVPFVPPRDTNRLRAYATSIPLLALLPSLGTAWMIEKTKKLSFLIRKEDNASFSLVLPLTIALLSFILIAPLGIRYYPRTANLKTSLCPASQQSLLIRYQKENTLVIRPDDDSFSDQMPQFHHNVFMQGLHDTPYLDLVKLFGSISPPFQLTSVLDIKQNMGVWLIAPGELSFPGHSGLYTVCGNYLTELDTNTQAYHENLFEVKYVFEAIYSDED